VILIGPPGAGKGTQARRLGSVLRVPHIASGDLLRDVRKADTPLARDVTSYMDRGEYVPDDLMNSLVLERLRQPDAAPGFILDGFPRTLPQAEALDRETAERGRHIDLVLYMTAPADVLSRRIEDRLFCPQCHAIYNVATRPPARGLLCDVCGHALDRRTDQEPEVMKTRLQEYIRQTQPLVAYYHRANVLRKIDGSRDIGEVDADVDGALGLQEVSCPRVYQ
jgi:adenylate kinase